MVEDIKYNKIIYSPTARNGAAATMSTKGMPAYIKTPKAVPMAKPADITPHNPEKERG